MKAIRKSRVARLIRRLSRPYYTHQFVTFALIATMAGIRYVISGEFWLAAAVALVVGIALWISSASLARTYHHSQKRLDQTIRRLQTSEEQFRVIFEEAGIGMALVGLDGKLIKTNRRLQRFLGYSAEELNGVSYTTIIHPDDLEKDRPQYQRLGRGEIDFFDMQRRFRRKDGKEVWGDLTATIVRSSQGEPLFSVGMIEDITEKHAAEQKVQQTEEVYRQAIAAAGGVPYQASWPERTYLFMGEGIKELTGYTAEEVTPDLFRSTIIEHVFLGPLAGTPEDEAARRVRSGEFPSWTVDYKIRTKDGQERWISDVSIELRNESGQSDGSIGFLQDVTARKRQEAELRQAKEAAEAANRSKSDFLANMSHEIRTPMNAIVGMATLLRESPLDEEQQDFVEIIHTSSEALLAILNDILDLSKIESGMMELEIQPLDLAKCLEDVRAMFAVRANEKNLSIRLEIAPETPRRILGDVTRLRQVLINLVGNAVKFTHEGEIVIAVDALSLAAGTAPDEPPTYRLTFAVHDTGIGIPAGSRQRLFQPFSQVDSSTTRKYGGSGLGLVISKRLVELMGGTIAVESTPGVGSTFSFEIVAAVATDGHQTATLSAQTHLKASHRIDPTLRILLAEDNLVNQKVVRYMLSRLGYKADVAATGCEVLARLAEKPYDLVLMDVQMPDMDGVEATRQLRSRLPARQQPYIIALTANVLAEHRDSYLAAGMDDYLSKPISVPAFIEALQRASVHRAGNTLAKETSHGPSDHHSGEAIAG